MDKHTYESERRRILNDDRYPSSLKGWALGILAKMQEMGIKMTPQEIKLRLEQIRAAVRHGDSEVAHSVEDSLYRDFIRYVVETADGELAEMAQAVLKSKEIRFDRWIA